MAALLPFKVPEISAADFSAFHEAHFSNLSTGHFESHFVRPDESVFASVSASAAADGLASGNGNAEAEEEYYYEEYDEEGYYNEDDDGLGYYPDGVKRTLTDEQIAIFRHSELEAMRRVRESAKIKKVMDPAADGVAVDIEDAIGEQLSEGEVNSPKDVLAGAGPSQQQQQQQKKRKNNKSNQNKSKNKRRGGKNNNHNNNRSDGGGEQIDLRKRTWDVVDKGLASLDYGEEEHGQPSDERAMQRRRISYAD